MEGIHYNKDVIKVIAREIKKSLYSNANRDNQQLSMMANMEAAVPSEATSAATPTTATDVNNAAITNDSNTSIVTANQFSALSVEQ